MPLLTDISDAVASELNTLDDAGDVTRIALRLLVSGALGAMIGFERESMGKSAGVRTHMLVAIGSSLFVIVPHLASFDVNSQSRVIQGLMAGIGFLGAGAIVKGRPGEEIQGLTTAATIWMTAALGMAVALGRDVSAIVAAVLALLILRVMPGTNTPPSQKS